MQEMAREIAELKELLKNERTARHQLERVQMDFVFFFLFFPTLPHKMYNNSFLPGRERERLHSGKRH
jgi:hypothetical protein